MANPRIDELRKRLEKEPGSRLFAQLAEELRKDGDLEEAIRVCREGLQRNPNYPSARMTLGRALFDTGDAAAARVQFEAVLKAAPDNILASRMLGESLELLGDVSGARASYELTLRMSPGDRQVKAKLEGLGQVPAAPEPPVVALRPAPPPPAPPPPPFEPPAFSLPPFELAGEEAAASEQPAAPAVETLEPPPIRLVDVEGPMELERPYEAPSTQVVGSEPGASTPAFRRAPTIQLQMPPEGDHEFELEQPYDVPTASLPRAVPPEAAAAPQRREREAERPAEPAEFVEFDEAPTLPGSTGDFERSFDTAPPAPAAPPAAAAPPPQPVRPQAVEFEDDFPAATIPWGFTTPGRREPQPAEPDTASTLVDVEASADLAAAAWDRDVARKAEPAASLPALAGPESQAEPSLFEARPLPSAARAPSTAEPTPEPMLEQGDEFMAEPVAEPMLEPADEFMAEPAEEPIAEPDELMAEPASEPFVESPAEPVAAPAIEEAIGEPAARPPVPEAAPESEQIASLTLAELYFNQGLPEEAAVILGRVIEREPGNEKARARLREIQGRTDERPGAEPGRPPAASPGPREERRREIVLLLGRLEQLLAAVRKG